MKFHELIDNHSEEKVQAYITEQMSQFAGKVYDISTVGRMSEVLSNTLTELKKVGIIVDSSIPIKLRGSGLVRQIMINGTIT